MSTRCSSNLDISFAVRDYLQIGLLGIVQGITELLPISSLAAIWGLMKFLEKFSTWPFVFYRAAMGIFLIVAISLGWLT